MKRLLITIDDETAKVLEKSGNKSETVRQALRVYQEDISTDTLSTIKQAFRYMERKHDETDARLVEVYTMVEQMKSTLDEFKHQ